MSKHPGICPHCRKNVTPEVIEENSLRRDKCECPECKGIVYVCRTLGCDNYAKGSNAYDDELCPDCAKILANNAGGILKGVAVIAVPAAASAIINKITGK